MNQNNTEFSASVNILRDAEQALNYIPTANSQDIFKQITHNFENTKQRAFLLVGAYGSGKSSFLWAFEQTLNKKSNYFSSLFNVFEKFDGFEFLSFVGAYQSLIATMEEKFAISKPKNKKAIFNALDTYYQDLHKQNKGLVILIDEFGKFLEYAAQNSPEQELYFVQELAEWACDSNKNVMLIASLHQGFSAYSFNLTESQRSEWRKVEGRLKELTFNEPVEQLLVLAAHHLSTHQQYKEIPANFTNLFEVIKNANKKIIKDHYTQKFAKTLYPFDILTATVLTQALQRYGQNERSLFSFLNSDDYLGLFDFYKSNLPYFNLCRLYDYLYHNFYDFLAQRSNPDYMQWANIKTALERVEGEALLQDIEQEAIKVVKVIGLLAIFAPQSSLIDIQFLANYLELSANHQDIFSVVQKLEKQKIIRFRGYAHRYILWEGSDIDIEKEIRKNIQEIDQDFDIVKEILNNFSLPYIIAKQTLLIKGTPRVFAFQISELPLKTLEPKDEIDGYINLIFSLKHTEDDVLKASKECKEAVLFGLFNNTEKIRKTILEIKAIQKVKADNPDDSIAIKELNSLETHYYLLLNRYILENLEVKNENISWFFRGEKITIQSIKQFNRQLSTIADEIYLDTPIYLNEMINTTEVSSQMIVARKTLFKQMFQAHHLEDLGFEKTNFMPEKTIYLSLIQNTGIHRKEGDSYSLVSPQDESFLPIWQAGERFLEQSKDNKKNLSELVEILSQKPFKLKKGLLEFWLPIFLFIKRHDFALYEDNIYKPDMTADDFDVIVRSPEKFEIKAFNVEGVKLEIFNSYRNLLNKVQTERPDNETFIETIKPF